MKLRVTAQGLIGEDAERGRWVRLPGSEDLLFFPGWRSEACTRAEAAMASAPQADPSTACCPSPRSIRAFMLWEQHVIDSGRMLVKRFFPAPAAKVILGYERLTGVPEAQAERPLPRGADFYVANHTSVLADGEDMWWPSHTKYLDFELELACVLAKPLVDATPEEAIERGGRLVRRTTGARATFRRTTRAQHLRPRRQVEDVRQFDRLRCRDRGRGAGLDRDARPRPRRRRALVRGTTRTSTRSARCSPTRPPGRARRG